jgi:hypothetical protein
MPENVTGFRPTENLKKSLIGLAYFDMLTRRSPTFFREEPKYQAGAGGELRGHPTVPHRPLNTMGAASGSAR